MHTVDTATNIHIPFIAFIANSAFLAVSLSLNCLPISFNLVTKVFKTSTPLSTKAPIPPITEIALAVVVSFSIIVMNDSIFLEVLSLFTLFTPLLTKSRTLSFSTHNTFTKSLSIVVFSIEDSSILSIVVAIDWTDPRIFTKDEKSLSLNFSVSISDNTSNIATIFFALFSELSVSPSFNILAISIKFGVNFFNESILVPSNSHPLYKFHWLTSCKISLTIPDLTTLSLFNKAEFISCNGNKISTILSLKFLTTFESIS